MIISSRFAEPVSRRLAGNSKAGLPWPDCGMSSALIAVLAVVAACTPTVQNNPNFFASSGGNRERSNLVPTGGGWIASSEIEITLVAEPKRTEGGELFAANPRVIGTVHADSMGIFGFDSDPFSYSVARAICGQPPEWLQKPFSIARDKHSGLVRTSSVSNASWFTFATCH